MFSSRYATAVLLALGCALVPTVMNTYLGRQLVETPALRDALPETLNGATSSPTARRASSIKREFDSEDWIERQYVDASGRQVVLLAVRSYDMKRLYHHPELAITEAKFDLEQVVQLGAGSDPVHVHMLRPSDDGGDSAAYVLLYKDRTVSNPLWFQVLVAPELLVMGRRPLTLLFAQTSGSRERADNALQEVLGQAVAAIRSGVREADLTPAPATDAGQGTAAGAPASR